MAILPLAQSRRLNLPGLKAPKISHAQSVLLIAFEGFEPAGALPPRRVRRANLLRRDAREPVEQEALLGSIEAGQGFRLRVNQRQLRGEQFQYRSRGRLIVYKDTALARSSNLPPQQNFTLACIDPMRLQNALRLFGGLEDAGDDRLLCPVTHDLTRCLASEQEGQSVHQDRFARAGLPGQQIQPGPQRGRGVIDNRIIFRSQLQQHKLFRGRA